MSMYYIAISVTGLNSINKKVYFKFYLQLVKLLPMKDPIFAASLVQLLPGNLKDQVHSKPTEAEAATCFLDNGITPALECGENEPFNILLSVMESFGSIPLRMLAQEIKKEIQENGSVMGE